MANKKNISFEEAMTALEETVSRLECGSVSLEESLKEFEEAIRLVKLCGQKLEAAKQKVKILVENEDGSITDKPFDDNSDET